MRNVISAFLALGMIGATAQAASLTNKTYSSARSAALAGAAYRLDKAAGWGRFSASDLRVSKTIDNKGPMQKFQVTTKSGFAKRTLVVSVKKDAAGKYRAYIPNRNVFTPTSTGRP